MTHRLFPDEDYRPRMGLSRGPIEAFFAPREDDRPLLGERRRALAAHGDRNLGHEPGADETVAEAISLLGSHGGHVPGAGLPVDERLRALGGHLAPDLLFLAPRDGELVLVAGVVCFPSSWSLAEKLGRPLPAIHGPVPGLEAELGAAIAHFLERLPAGQAYLRSNYGLSASPTLDQHPASACPRLHADTPLERVHVRIEDQAFVALPRTGGVLFGIRLRTFPVARLASDRDALAGLHRALVSMPAPMASYKGLETVRPALVAHLESLLEALPPKA